MVSSLLKSDYVNKHSVFTVIFCGKRYSMKGNKKILVIAALLLLIAVSYSTYAIYKTSATTQMQQLLQLHGQ